MPFLMNVCKDDINDMFIHKACKNDSTFWVKRFLTKSNSRVIGYSPTYKFRIVYKLVLHHIQNYLGRLRRGSTQVQQKQPSTSKRANTNSDSDGEDDDDQMEGYWQRRRRLDGALNRVPLGFYTKVNHSTNSTDIKVLTTPHCLKVWKVLEKCQSLRMQTNNALFHGLTQEVSHLVLALSRALYKFILLYLFISNVQIILVQTHATERPKYAIP